MFLVVAISLTLSLTLFAAMYSHKRHLLLLNAMLPAKVSAGGGGNQSQHHMSFAANSLGRYMLLGVTLLAARQGEGEGVGGATLHS